MKPYIAQNFEFRPHIFFIPGQSWVFGDTAISGSNLGLGIKVFYFFESLHQELSDGMLVYFLAPKGAES